MSSTQTQELVWSDAPNQRIGAVWCWTLMFLIGACVMDLSHTPHLLLASICFTATILLAFLACLAWAAALIVGIVLHLAMYSDLPAIYFGVVYSFWIVHRARKVSVILMLDHDWSFADCRLLMRRKILHALTALIVTSTVLTFVRTVLELYMAADYGIAAGWFYVAGVSLGGASFFLPYLKAAHNIKMVAKTKAMV
ncbi:MAG: hypothetical protein U0105_11430 [Candidatus Obscuribacterales bacterium]